MSPTQQIVSSNAHALSRPRSPLGPGVRRVEPQGPMWPSRVVMSGEGSEDHFQVTSTEQQHPVQALCPDRANPPLCEGVRSGSPNRGLEDPHALASEDLVEGAGELGVPVPDKEPDPLE